MGSLWAEEKKIKLSGKRMVLAIAGVTGAASSHRTFPRSPETVCNAAYFAEKCDFPKAGQQRESLVSRAGLQRNFTSKRNLQIQCTCVGLNRPTRRNLYIFTVTTHQFTD